MDINAIVEKYYSTNNEAGEFFRRWLIKVEAQHNIDELLSKATDKDAIAELFFANERRGKVSLNSYRKTKNFIVQLFGYFDLSPSIPAHEEIVELKEETVYFKDLQDVIDYIDEQASTLMPPYNKVNDMQVLKSIVILGWHGVDLNDIISIRKADIVKGNDSYYVKTPKGDITLEYYEWFILSGLALAEGHRGFPSGKWQTYHGNEDLLFRTTKLSGEKVEPNALITVIYRFNKKSTGTRKILFGALNLNALFIAIYNDNTSISLKDKIMKHTKCTQATMAYSYRRDYYRWLKLYHPEDYNI